MKTIIFDASVIIKTLVDEPGSQTALECMDACLSRYYQLKAPNLFQYEIASVCIREGVSLDQYSDFMENTINTIIIQFSPTRKIWQKADEIVQKGNSKSGFPSIYDSIYHAMAIVENGVFITADHRHYDKSKSFGHIVMLEDWKTIFDD